MDTANIYTNGHSEKILGDLLGRESSRRERLVIGTKCGNNLRPDDPNGAKALIAQCEQFEQSLQRLQTDSSTCTGCTTGNRTRRHRKQ